MAKRKRLTPPSFSASEGIPPQLETKSYRGTPPISGIVHDAASASALEEMSHALREARESGRMVLDVPIVQIQLDHLVRDRVMTDPEELEALVSSLRARGQQQPVEVVSLGPDSYGLISGWRRCLALSQIAAEEGRPAHVLALLRSPQEASDAYLAMVEENEIRVGLSYYERAHIVLRTVEQGVYDSDKSALQSLFQSASRAKRSKIGSFTHIVRALDGALRFPTAMGERAGLTLARRLEDDPALGPRLVALLEAQAPDTAEQERALLEQGLVVAPPAPRQTPEKTAERNHADAPAVDDTLAQAVPPKEQAERTEGGRKVAAAVWMHDNPDGSITLKGPGLTKASRDSLLRWISVNL